ncbi:hypothetical protein [Coralloluteibacterium thermophilus]|uniref:Uncharacterized protein n=1 Tax=Coralloluteibacterium thermophilum TaxID=2707049 RepID=A0ABV9NGT0_9GAMM
MHDAPEIWLDRLSEAANGEPLPDPDTISDELLPYQPEAVCDAEIRARKLEVEIEALRAEMGELHMSAQRRDQYAAEKAAQAADAIARAERLAEALREYRHAPKFSRDHAAIKRTVELEDEIDALLREQEEGRG